MFMELAHTIEKWRIVYEEALFEAVRKKNLTAGKKISNKFIFLVVEIGQKLIAVGI